jgi:hypothetical protein
MLLYSQVDLAEAPMYIVSVMSWIIDLILMLDSSSFEMPFGLAWGELARNPWLYLTSIQLPSKVCLQ